MSSIPSSQSMLDANQVKMIQNENLSLKISLDKANRELDDVLMENDKHREKISELEKWIVMLLNNFYSGTPQTLQSIQNGLGSIDDLRNEKFVLKKTILYERKKFHDLQEAYLALQKRQREREDDMKQSQIGQLVIQKQALEDNLKLLSDEVETLSSKNERLLSDMKQKEFFKSYNSVLEELQELKKSHAQLIQTVNIDGKSIGNKVRMSNRAGSVQMPQSTIMHPSLIPGGPGAIKRPGATAANLFSFISCQGCTGGNTVGGGMPNQFGEHFENQKEEYEAIVDRQQDINFLSPMNKQDRKVRSFK